MVGIDLGYLGHLGWIVAVMTGGMVRVCDADLRIRAIALLAGELEGDDARDIRLKGQDLQVKHELGVVGERRRNTYGPIEIGHLIARHRLLGTLDLTLPDACPAAPDQWQVLVQADGYFLTGGAASGGSATVALSTDGTNFVSGSVLNQNITSPGQWREPFSTSFLFTVDAGTTTFSVLGSTNIGAGVSAAQLNVIAQSIAVVC